MTFQTTVPVSEADPIQAEQHARDWINILRKYRDPSTARSWFEVAVTLTPFIALWALACWVAPHSYIGAFLISAVNGMFLLRLFAIQHDCGHGSFFKNRQVSDWTGRALGILTLTPYDVWARAHAIHHSHAGDLDHRGLGDINTLTVAEYNALDRMGRLKYRLYRHPLVMFGLGPSYIFLLCNRLPFGMMNGARYWVSAMGTNIGIALVITAILYFGGWPALLLVFLPSSIVAASVGVWLFYVQHQFETTHWEGADNWQVHEAALHGSSHYDLPVVLRWLTANIGIHHVHHLYSRIPFYRLTEVLRDHAELVETSRLTLASSLQCARLNLWDEDKRRLVPFGA